MNHVSNERLRVLARFIRGQALLTDKHPPQAGPGSVQLNHEEAMLAAFALDEELRHRESLHLAQHWLRDLLAYVERQWLEWAEEVAMGGGTGSGAVERMAHDPALARSCAMVDKYRALAAIVRERIELPGTVTIQENEAGECVAVTRTDEEHRILAVIWERKVKSDGP